jgi:hypothetical protein
MEGAARRLFFGTTEDIACFHGSRDPAHWQKRA